MEFTMLSTRVLAGDPSVIIFDEATSALDASTEEKVMEAIKNRGLTVLIVAHRLSTVRDADEILVLQNGQLIQGTIFTNLMIAYPELTEKRHGKHWNWQLLLRMCAECL